MSNKNLSQLIYKHFLKKKRKNQIKNTPFLNEVFPGKN